MAAKTTSTTKDDVKAKDDELKQPANIPAATGFESSGAPQQTTEIDPSHPAVDDNPRRDTTKLQNKADMNDPNLSMEEAVVANLRKGGSGSVVEGNNDDGSAKAGSDTK